jgi:hypothetical protein
MTWDEMEQANLARLRSDYRDLTGPERVRQVIELSRFMTRLADAGHSARGR